MVNFWVNGKEVSLEEEKRLVHYLRYTLRLTSVKDGCSEGACGTCTILIDGVATKACSVATTEMEGKHITTVEGLSDREKDVYTYAFGQAGAVQCGFCIPGMIICAKALLDVNKNPSEKEIRHAIRNNICRCTGYAKIVKAIELAAEIFRSESDVCSDLNWKIGKRVPRVDVRDKVTAKAIYPDDIYIDGMLNLVAVRSEYPRARVLSIDKEAAEKSQGVFKVYTAADIPGNKIVGHLKRDWPTMIDIGEITNYVGDVICLVAADNRDNAYKARDLVKVEYEVLPCVKSPFEAMKEDAPLVHEDGNLLGHTCVDRGDVDKALENSDFVLSEHFETPWTEHAFLEPECAVAVPWNDGVKIYSTDQGVYDTRRETAPMLGLPEDKVVVENCYVGGGFGGKEDVTVQHLVALVAYLSKRPCKMKLTRDESIAVHPKRHPMYMDFTLGCNKEGIIQALDAKVIADTGAYASLGLPVLQRACTHASGPYNYQNFRINGYSYYTNNPPAGAFRGFGVTQTCFAIETLLNRMADKVGISHWEIRFRNAIRPGQSLPNGQIVDNSTGLVETLLAVKEQYEASEHAGIACAMKNAGVGVGLPDWGRMRLVIENGKVVMHTGGSCIGQGMWTVMKQIVCEVTGLEADLVVNGPACTQDSPDSGTTSGSRHTTVTGEAARRAGVMLKQQLDKSLTLKDLEGQEFFAEYLAKTDPFGSDLPNPKSHVAYGYATQICILDEDNHKVSKIIAAHDVGRAINPTNVEGQIEGGVVMGLGFALREKYELEDCIPKSKFANLGLFRADEVPDIEPVIVEKEGLETSSGAIGLGEITSIPTAPAVADAYSRLDGVQRNVLPLENTPYDENFRKNNKRKAKMLTVNPDVRCIGCQECVHACSQLFYKTLKASKACLAIREKEGTGNKSGIKGTISRPVVCIQCGKCASVCPVGAIKQNNLGVYVIDRKMCIGCGKCRQACPFGIMVENEELGITSKCISCGACAKACPMGVLGVSQVE